MKIKYWISLLSSVMTAFATSASANEGECSTCPCAPGATGHPKIECQLKTAGVFCANENGHIFGWSLSDRATYFVDNFAGMPNPSTSYHILPLAANSSFAILEIHWDGTVVGQNGPFHWVDEKTITDGKKTFSLDACGGTK